MLYVLDLVFRQIFLDLNCCWDGSLFSSSPTYVSPNLTACCNLAAYVHEVFCSSSLSSRYYSAFLLRQSGMNWFSSNSLYPKKATLLEGHLSFMYLAHRECVLQNNSAGLFHGLLRLPPFHPIPKTGQNTISHFLRFWRKIAKDIYT